MTLDEALALPPGVDLDREVARVVFGQTWQGGSTIPGYDGKRPWPPPYSTDIAAAFEVVRHITAVMARSDFHLVYDCDTEDWLAYFPGPTDARGETAPLAIVRSALRACWDVERR